MRTLHVVFLAFLVLAVSQVLDSKLIHLKPGTEYYYNYYGHYLSKLDNVGNRHVGFGMKAKVIVQVKSRELSIFKLERIRTAMLNDDIYQVDETSIPWQFQDEQGPLASQLEKPVRVHWSEGKVTKLEVSSTVTEVALNMVKGVVANFQLNIPRISSPYPEIEPYSSPSFSQRNAIYINGQNIIDDVNVFKSMEDGIGGQCRTRYVVESIPSPYHPNAEVLNITKYPNFHKCEDAPFWVRSTHVPNKCADCDADDQHVFSVVATIEYSVKKHGEELTMERIKSEAQTRFAPYTTQFNHFVSNHSQIFVLLKKDAVFTNIPPIVSPRIVPSLKYSFPTAEHVRHLGAHDLLKKHMLPFFHDSKVNAVQEAKVLLEVVVKNIREEVAIEETPGKVLQLVKLIRLMNKDDIARFYNEGCAVHRGLGTTPFPPVPANLLHQVCIDALGMSGSYPAIIQLKYLIESKQIFGERAVQVVQAMPTNIFEPSEEIISQILSISKSQVAKDSPQIHITSVLSAAILMGKACDGPEDDVPSLPTAPHIDTLCPAEIERKYIHELAEGLRVSRRRGFKMVYIRALGLTGLPTAIGPLRAFAEGIALEDEVVQIAALRALTNIAKYSPDETMDIGEGEFYDTDNPKSVRIAALKLILSAQPDLADMKRIVAWYEKEPSDDVKGYIYAQFDVLSNTTHYCMKDMASNAEQLMSYLDEEDDNGILGSTVYESSQIMDDLGISTRGVLSVTSSNSSIIPEAVTAKLNMTVAGFSVKPFKFGFQSKGTQALLNRFVGPSGKFNKLNSLADLFRPESEIQDKQWSPLNGKLNLNSLTDDPFFFSAFLKLGDTQARMFHADHKEVLEYLRSGLPSGFTLQSLREGIPIRYNKIALPLEVRVQVPSILGVPTYVSVASVVIIRVQGKIAVKFDPLAPLQGIEILADIKPAISTRLEMRQGVYNPFKHVISMVAVGTSTYIAPPISAKMHLNILKGKVNFEVKPIAESYQSTTSSPKVFHHKVRPYSLHKSLTAAPVGDTKFEHKLIHTDFEPDVQDIDLSHHLLGLPLVFKSKSEHDWPDQASFLSYLKQYDGVIPFLTTYQVTPEFDNRQYEMYLNGEGAKGKSIQAALEWEYVPTPSERLVLQKMNSKRGFWPVISGFASLPQRCGSKPEQYSSDNDDYWYVYRQALKVSMNIAEDDVDDDEDDDDDDATEDDNDRYYNYQSSYYNGGNKYYYSSLGYNKSLSQYFKSPWQYSSERSIKTAYPYKQDYDNAEDSDAIYYKGGALPYSSKTRSDKSGTISTIDRTNDISEYHVRTKIYGYGQTTAKLATAFVLKRDMTSQTDIITFTVELDNNTVSGNKVLKICTTATVKYPEVPCDYHSLMSPRAAKPIHANIGISWGHECPSPHAITIKAKFEKSREQQRLESEKDEWYFKQCQVDIANGKKLTDACANAQLEFSSLNKLTVDIDYPKLPSWLKNLTAHTDTFLKSMFYPQMSNNPVDVNNGEGHLKLVGVLVDEVPSVNFYMFKPHENTFFRKVYLEEYYPYIYSVSTQKTHLEQLVEDVTDGDAYPSCEVMGKYINTFDNTTYRHYISECEHVIVKDCSPDDLFAVTMKQKSNNIKYMKVYLLSHEIIVRPQGRYNGQFELEIDGEKFQPTDDKVIVLQGTGEVAQGAVLALILTTGPTLTIKAPTIGLAIDFDGEDASIEVSPLWASRVCGLCGQYNDESDDDFRGPQQCLYGDARSFSVSYGIPSPQCQLPPPGTTKKFCDFNSPIDYISRRSTFYDDDFGIAKASYRPYSQKDTSPPTHNTEIDIDEHNVFGSDEVNIGNVGIAYDEVGDQVDDDFITPMSSYRPNNRKYSPRRPLNGDISVNQGPPTFGGNKVEINVGKDNY